MAVTENDIVQNAAGIAQLINSSPADVDINGLPEVTSWANTDHAHIQKSGVDSKIKKSNFIVSESVLTGSILSYGNDSIPTGYLFCDGSAISRTTYSDLFAAIGTTWGVGDGSTTFNLPDLRGVFIRGTGSHGSLTMADGNPFAGPTVGSSENDQGQGHVHWNPQTANRYSVSGTGSDGGLGNSGHISAHITNGPQDDSVNGTPRSGDETRPVNFGVKNLIKY